MGNGECEWGIRNVEWVMEKWEVENWKFNFFLH